MIGEDTLPLIAIVGRPNVGKSTLWNRLVGGRKALVEDEPGVTRDRRYGETDYAGRRFRLVDTGGLDPHAAGGVVTAGIHRQAQRAIDEADLIVFLADVRDGLMPTDRDVAKSLRKSGKPVIVAANKVDAGSHEALAGELYELGLGQVVPVSAEHGRGIGELLDRILEALPQAVVLPGGNVGAEPEPIRLLFAGRPNVGKSSLVNRILGEERSLVHDVPGTTTDPVDTPLVVGGRSYVLVDTAGIRKRPRIERPTEKIAVSMALGQIGRADVVALVIDAKEGSGEQDAKIAGAVEEAGAAMLVLLNKADLVSKSREDDLRRRVHETLRFVDYAPIRFVSAATGRGVAEALEAAARCYDERSRRVGTGELNRFFAEVCETHPPPTFRGRPVRIHYLTQVSSGPPTFVLWANRPDLVHRPYRRFLEKKLRERFGFQGTPMRVIARRRSGAA